MGANWGSCTVSISFLSFAIYQTNCVNGEMLPQVESVVRGRDAFSFVALSKEDLHIFMTEVRKWHLISEAIRISLAEPNHLHSLYFIVAFCSLTYLDARKEKAQGEWCHSPQQTIVQFQTRNINGEIEVRTKSGSCWDGGQY